MSITAKLAELGLTLPTPPHPVAAYVPAVRTGNLLYIAGQLPSLNGKLLVTGPVPTAVTVAAAADGARQCVLNALAIANANLDGDLTRLKRVVRLGVFVQTEAATGFADHPKVANGASELLVALLGDAGKHARTTIGVPSLPLDAAVEVEFLFEVAG